MSDDFESFLSGGKSSGGDELDPDVAGSSPLSQTLDFGNINLDEIDENAADFPALPPGWYPCVVLNVEPKMSKAKNPMLVVTFELLGEYKSRQMFYNLVLNKESGLRRLKKWILIACGPDFDFRGFNPTKFAESGIALGRPCRIRLKIGMYEGKQNNSVTDVMPYEDDDASGFDLPI